jgi:hypothetical protein
VQEIAESIYHDLASALWSAAIESVRAHLEKLCAEAKALKQEGRWRRPEEEIWKSRQNAGALDIWTE